MTKRFFESAEFIKEIINKAVSSIMIVDSDMRIFLINSRASENFGIQTDLAYMKRTGEIFRCIHSSHIKKPCGKMPACSDCTIRKAVNNALEKGKVVKSKARIKILKENDINDAIICLSAEPFKYRGKYFVVLNLLEFSPETDEERITHICASCKKVLNSNGKWQDMKSIFFESGDVNFAHSICPECVKKYYPDLVDSDG